MVNFEVRVERAFDGSFFISRVFAVDAEHDEFLVYDPGEAADGDEDGIDSAFLWVNIVDCKLFFVSEK